LVGVWNDFQDWNFWRNRQRRGAHVSVPEIGSRATLLCLGGIWGSHADLRREFKGRNLNLGVFGILGVVPRGVTEEGGHYVLLLYIGGVFWSIGLGLIGRRLGNGVTYWTLGYAGTRGLGGDVTVTGEVFPLRAVKGASYNWLIHYWLYRGTESTLSKHTYCAQGSTLSKHTKSKRIISTLYCAREKSACGPQG
jgi:hypothetical protein